MKKAILFTLTKRSLVVISSLLLVLLSSYGNNLYAKNLKVLYEKTYTTKAGKSFNLSTTTGNVYISTWDKPEVYVKISGNEKAEKDIQFKFESSDEGVNITAKKEGWFHWFSNNNYYLKYEVKVPSNYNTNVNTAGGDIKLYDLAGTIKFKTSGGNLYLYNTTGKLNATTSGGDVLLENNSGDINLTTSGGQIESKNFNGDISASTSGGDIKLDGSDGKVSAKTSGGDIRLSYKGMNKGISLHSSGGDISVKLPENFSANVDLSTSGGSVECGFPITKNGRMTSSKVTGDMNGGGNELLCRTSGGDITVAK